jgi:uncharacterized protein YuzE
MTYDAAADAAFISLVEIGPGQVARSQPTEAGPILHWTKEGHLVGIEVLMASRFLPTHLLDEARSQSGR